MTFGTGLPHNGQPAAIAAPEFNEPELTEVERLKAIIRHLDEAKRLASGSSLPFWLVGYIDHALQHAGFVSRCRPGAAS